LCLLDEALDFSYHRLLFLGQLTIRQRPQAGLGARQALVDGRIVLALLLRRQNVTESWRLIAGRRVGLPGGIGLRSRPA
jgi:hypothetical protein